MRSSHETRYLEDLLQVLTIRRQEAERKACRSSTCKKQRSD